MAYAGSTNLGALFANRREKGLSGLPTLSVTLDSGLVERTSLDRKTETHLEDAEHLLVRKGDIAYNMMRMWQGASGFAEKDGLLSPAYIVLAPKKEIDSQYASYLFKSARLIYLFWAYSYGLTNDRRRLYFNDFKKIPVDIPPLPEQQKIARILSTWDKAIATIEKLIENSKAQKKALMQQLLTGKVRLPGFSEEWKQHRLGDHCVFKGGVAFKEVYQGSTSGDFPFIKVSDMSLPRNEKFILIANNWVTDKVQAEIKVKPFPVGAVVFAKVGAALLLNRRRILVRETIIDNNMMAAMPKPSLDSEFLYQTMLMIDFAKFVRDGAVPSVNQADIVSIRLRLPELAEQQKISTVLSNADREVENRQLHLSALKQQKTALMQQLLTGKRRVNTSGFCESGLKGRQ